METGPPVDPVALAVALALFAAAAAVAVGRENSGLRVRRRDFAPWAGMCVFALPALASMVTASLPGAAVDAVLILAGTCITYVFQRRVVRRARDAGMGKRIAYIGAIPIVNLAVFVILLAAPTASPGADAGAVTMVGDPG